MTLTGIKSTRNELEEIRAMFPRPSEMSPEEAFLASCTPAEICKISEILIRFDDDQEIDLEQLTPDEIEFLVNINERPVPPMQPIDHSQPRCHACGRQPAHLWDASDVFSFCDACFEQLGGNVDASKLL